MSDTGHEAFDKPITLEDIWGDNLPEALRGRGLLTDDLSNGNLTIARTGEGFAYVDNRLETQPEQGEL
jgi:hypothetical protein